MDKRGSGEQGRYDIPYTSSQWTCCLNCNFGPVDSEFKIKRHWLFILRNPSSLLHYVISFFVVTHYSLNVYCTFDDLYDVFEKKCSIIDHTWQLLLL